MFTGLVEVMTRITEIEPTDAGVRLVLSDPGWADPPAPGDSVAVDGCCLTVAAADRLAFDVIPQTLSCTSLGQLEVGAEVNLERAVLPTTRLGGHFVLGHVDGVGRVSRIVRDETGHRITIGVPDGTGRYLVDKGSIAVAGVSLTIAEAGEDEFTVALIPTTLAETSLGVLAEGGMVNIEFDYLAKVVERLAR